MGLRFGVWSLGFEANREVGSNAAGMQGYNQDFQDVTVLKPAVPTRQA